MTAPGTPGSTVRYVRPGAVSAGVVFASLSLTFALADVSMFSSVGASALVLLQTVWGASVWGRLTPSRSSSPWERLGMGFVIGLVGIVVAGQLRAALGVAPLIWWSAIIGVALLDVARTRPTLRDVLPSTAELWLAWSAALVILGPQWYWTLPVGGSLYLVALAHQFSESRRLRWVTLVIALGTTVLTVVNRPTAWRPLMFEQIYLEFVGRAAVDFGGWNNPLALGRSLDYHWVSYAWMMTYSDLLGLARLESLVKAGPILIALGAVAAAAALASRIGGTRALWWALPALAFFDTPRVWSWGGHVGQLQSQSQFLGSVMLVAIAVVMLEFLRHREVGVAAMVFMFATATILTKSSHALIVLGAVVGVGIVEVIGGSVARRLWVMAVLIVSGMASGYLVFLRGDERHRLMPSWMTFAWEMRGDLRDWVGREPWYTIAALMLIVGCSGAVVALVAATPVVCTTMDHRRALGLAGGAVVAGIGGTAFLDSSGVDSSQMYFSMAPSALAIVVSMSIVGGRVHGVARSRVFLALLCGGLVSALSILSPLPTSGSPAAIAMRLVPLLAPLVAASIGFVLGTGVSPSLRGILVTVAVIGTTSATLVGNAVATRASQLGERRVEARPLDDRFDAVGRWSRANTHASDVLASNFFCTQLECAGEDWFDEYGQRIIPHRIGPAESLEVGGVRFGAVELALATERRFLIQGYAWLWTYGEPPAWLEERVELSVGFANSPTEDEHRRLVEAGVDWFVVDLRLTDTREWLPTTPVVYDDGEFVVLRLVPAT